jgi:hypothetical protein
MQSFICTSCGRVFPPQCSFTRHHCSAHACRHPNSTNYSALDGLDKVLADHIPQCDDDTPSQRPEIELFPNAGALINDTVQVQTFEEDDWNPLAPFATPQQWELCSPMVGTNLGKMKLNNVLKQKLIVPDVSAYTVISFFNSLRTLKKWMGFDTDGRRLLLNMKEELLHSGIETPLKHYDIF